LKIVLDKYNPGIDFLGKSDIMIITLIKEGIGMPGFDRTGPRGVGPRTGWGRGPCGAGRAFCRGFRGFGRGFGAGWDQEEDAPGSGLLARLAALEEEVSRLRGGQKKSEE